MNIPTWSEHEATNPESVAASFEALAAESKWFAQELDKINSSRSIVSIACADRLVALGQRLKPAALERDRLARLDPAELQAGVDLWLLRRQRASSLRDMP